MNVPLGPVGAEQPREVPPAAAESPLSVVPLIVLPESVPSNSLLTAQQDGSVSMRTAFEEALKLPLRMARVVTGV